MGKPLRPGEIRITIKPADAPSDSARLIPATVLQRTFSTVLNALKVADAILHHKRQRGAFYISDMAMGSNELTMYEQARSTDRAVDLLKQFATSVYLSEFERATASPKLAKAVVKIGEAVDADYPALAEFESGELPLDKFFAGQAVRLARAMSPVAPKNRYFVGNALGSFDGTLGNIDYRGATWFGHLVLPGGGAEIECVFDKSLGEDAFNPFGNKRVTVRGRSIYTGDSQLPERIEVIHVEAIPLAREAIDIRGSMTGKRYRGAEDIGGTNLQ